MAKNRYVAAAVSKVTTLAQLLSHFAKGRTFFLIPLLIVILLSAVLLILAGGLSYVAPFVYSIV